MDVHMDFDRGTILHNLFNAPFECHNFSMILVIKSLFDAAIYFMIFYVYTVTYKAHVNYLTRD